MPTKVNEKRSRAWGVPRGKRLNPGAPPMPFSVAYEKFKQQHEERYGIKPNDIDLIMTAMLQQFDELRELHEKELKNYKGVEYGTHIDCVKTRRRRPSDR